MFGSPSGPLHDPRGALTGDGVIVDGYLLARLDVHLPIDEPYGNTRSTGVVRRISVTRSCQACISRHRAPTCFAFRPGF